MCYFSNSDLVREWNLLVYLFPLVLPSSHFSVLIISFHQVIIIIIFKEEKEETTVEKFFNLNEGVSNCVVFLVCFILDGSSTELIFAVQ